MSEEDNRYKPSEEYNKCYKMAKTLTPYEQFSLASELICDFQENINNNKKETNKDC